MVSRFLLLTALSCCVCGLELNMAHSSYQAEEKQSLTLDWTFTPKPHPSLKGLYVFCDMMKKRKVSVLFDLQDGVEIPLRDGELSGRFQFDKDLLREGRIRLHVSSLRTEDSGQYWCGVRTDSGSRVDGCLLTVTAARNQTQSKTEPTRNQTQSKTEPARNQTQSKTGPARNQTQSKTEPARNQNQSKTGPARNQTQSKTGPARNQNQSKTGPARNQNQSKTGPARNQNQSKTGPARNQTQSKTGPARNQNQSKNGPARKQNQSKTGPARNQTQSKTGPARNQNQSKNGPARKQTQSKTGPARNQNQSKNGPARKQTQSKTGPARNQTQSKTEPARNQTPCSTETEKPDSGGPGRMAFTWQQVLIAAVMLLFVLNFLVILVLTLKYFALMKETETLRCLKLSKEPGDFVSTVSF